MTHPNPCIIDYETPTESESAERQFLRVVIGFFITCATLMIFIAFVGLLSQFLSRPRAQYVRVNCPSNLRQLGQAVQMYIADQKAPPDTLVNLMTATRMSPRVLVCPHTNISPATQPADLLNNPNLCSYIILFEHQPPEWFKDPKRVLAYDNPKNHSGNGISVLYADGHVDSLDKNAMNTLLKEINAGNNPPNAK